MCPSGRYPCPTSATPPDFRPAFDVIDADRDGKISSEDLRLFYSSRSSNPAASDGVIASMMSSADSDRNGFVDFEEFERVVAAGGARDGGEEMGIMEEVFRVMDRDEDGRVRFEDLKAYLEWAGMALGDDDVRAMMMMSGGDESEGIGFDGLVKILAIDFGH